MQIEPINDDDAHAQAVLELKRLWDEEGDEKAARFDTLATLVDGYERKRWPIELLLPVDAIRAHMTANNLRKADLAKVLGSQPRASEILNRVRPLTIDMIRALNASWGIPADLLIAPYELRRVPKGTGSPKSETSQTLKRTG